MNVNLQNYLKYKSKYLNLKNKYFGKGSGKKENKLLKDVEKICDIYNDKNNINYQKIKEFIIKLLNSTNEILQIIESEKNFESENGETSEGVGERLRETGERESERLRQRYLCRFRTRS